MVKLFADGADLATMLKLNSDPSIAGFTTNPTLMRAAGVVSYEAFARTVLGVIRNKPVSLEVFSDDFDEMVRQALKIASWGENVYVKIPVTNTKGEFSGSSITMLSQRVKLNVTAIMTIGQVNDVLRALLSPAIISVFAGRIADTGTDPSTVVGLARAVIDAWAPECQLLWASPRELLNIRQAEACGCDIITLGSDLLAKRHLLGKDLTEFSLDTVKMFRDDAVKAGYML